MRERYTHRGREGRSRLLDELCELCGYERKYAIKRLGGKRRIAGKTKRRSGSKAKFGEAERGVLRRDRVLGATPPFIVVLASIERPALKHSAGARRNHAVRFQTVECST